MAHERDELTHLDGRSEAMEQLALERLLIGLAGLDTPAREFPHQRKDGGGAALGDEILAVAFEDRRDHTDGAHRGGGGRWRRWRSRRIGHQTATRNNCCPMSSTSP